MVPALAFVVTDLIAKRTGWCKTTSRVGRENKLVTAGIIAWFIYHIYIEGYAYED